MTAPEAGAQAPALYGLEFIPGCNTPGDVCYAQAAANIRRDVPWLTMEAKKDRPLIVVGGGPSLKWRWQEILAHDGAIMACNNAYGFLVERGIVPDYFVLLDAREGNIDFVQCARPSVVHYLAAQVHPSVYDRLEGFDTRLYLTSQERVGELVTGSRKDKLVIGGTVGTVGMKALSIGYALGFTDFHLYGYDSSYHQEAHHAYSQRLNDETKTIDVYLGDQRFVTSPSMAHQAAEFPAAVKSLQEKGCTFELHCDGLLLYYVALCNTLGELPLEQRERDKYRQAWATESYRHHAPGESFVAHAVEHLGIQPRDSVIDFGCGTGRGAKLMQDYGCRVTGVDFVRDALETDIPFVEACLWDLPDLSADWGFCTDVMEHIPPEKTDEVLAGIASRVRGCYFNIALTPDKAGRQIGRKLHVSLLPALGWYYKIRHHFANVAMIEGDGEAVFIATHKDH